MYKIRAKNLITDIEWEEYGFKKYMIKRVDYLLNHEDFEVIWVHKLCKSWDTFKKCLIREEKLL